MAEVNHYIFADSDSDQSFHGFTAEELNESIPREDISVEEYSSESENEGNSEEENGEETDDEAELLQAGGNVQRQPERVASQLEANSTGMKICLQKCWWTMLTLQGL